MKQSPSRSRTEYTQAYSHLRLGSGYWEDDKLDKFDDVTVDCAILSYDYHDSHFDGWLNRTRMSQFHNRMHLIMFAGSIPLR